jgi:hypothetical protein
MYTLYMPRQHQQLRRTGNKTRAFFPAFLYTRIDGKSYIGTENRNKRRISAETQYKYIYCTLGICDYT